MVALAIPECNCIRVTAKVRRQSRYNVALVPETAESVPSQRRRPPSISGASAKILAKPFDSPEDWLLYPVPTCAKLTGNATRREQPLKTENPDTRGGTEASACL